MKTQKIAGIAAIALGGFISSCDLLKNVTYEVVPCPLEMHGDSVEVTINAKIGEKGMNKKAYVEFTPMIGNTALKTVAYQGEKATGNGKVITKAGGSISYTDKVPYTDDMENTSLMIKVKATKGEGGGKETNYDTDELCKGTIITPRLTDQTGRVIAGTDAFERPTKHDTAFVINYLKDRSEVRASELKDDDIVAMGDFVAMSTENPKIELNGLHADGHASPEGEEERNENLSTNRYESGNKAAEKIFKKNGFEAEDESFFSGKANGEDVQGFKELVQAYDKEGTQLFEDKDVILRMLDNYQDSKDQEIKAMSKTYKELEKYILPQLRRTRLTLNYTNLGLTDEELVAVSKSNPDSLTAEELLFTATLTDDLNEKLRLFKEVERQYPDDWRGPNNAGYVLYMQGKVSEAEAAFQKAAGIEENAIITNNLGAVALIQGDRRKAMELFEPSTSAGQEVSYNMGVVYILDGKYSSAVEAFGSENTYNKALAQLLNGDTGGALATIDDSDDKESARGYYLKAIIGSRTNNQEMVINNLKSAISKDASLKDKAKKDMEFLKWMELDAFKAL